MASTDGRETWVVSSWTFSEMLLLSTPSRRKLLCSARAPWTLTPPVRPKDVPPPCSVKRSPCTPGPRGVRLEPARDVGRAVGDVHGGIRADGPRLVPHDAAERGAIHLGMGEGRHAGHGQNADEAQGPAQASIHGSLLLAPAFSQPRSHP